MDNFRRSLHLIGINLEVEVKGKIINLTYCKTTSQDNYLKSLKEVFKDLTDNMINEIQFYIPFYKIKCTKGLMESPYKFFLVNIELYHKMNEDVLPYKLINCNVYTTEKYSVYEIVSRLANNISEYDIKDYTSINLSLDMGRINNNILTTIIKSMTLYNIYMIPTNKNEDLYTLSDLTTNLIYNIFVTKINNDNNYYKAKVFKDNINKVIIKCVAKTHNLLIKESVADELALARLSKTTRYRNNLFNNMFYTK